jgi:outer membrane protein insertion porin family
MVRRLVVVAATAAAWLGLVLLLAEASARADEPEGQPAPDAPPAAIVEDPKRADKTRVGTEDPEFGPVVTIERIDVVGNVLTAERLIERALLVHEGDALRTGDPRLRNSRYRVLALGYFVDAQVRLDRGSARGKVVLTVEVWERGTFILNRIFLGASTATPLWAGLDVGDGNFLGSGLTVSGAFVVARAPVWEGGETQWALRLRYSDPSVFGLPMGLRAVFLYNQASEGEERAVLPASPADDPDNYLGFGYTRVGGKVGVSWEPTRSVSLLADLRLELVEADPSRRTYLEAGTTRVATVAVGVERDTRSDPVLPQMGDHAFLDLEGGGRATGSDYAYARVRGRWQHWWPIVGERHVLSLAARGGIVFGRPPGFDLIYVSELDRLLPPRPLDLSVSTQRPLDLLGQNSAAPRLGTAGGIVEAEYRYRLFRRTRRIYGGDLFVAAGVFGLRNDLDGYPDYAVDLSFDLGVRLDTEVGIFEVSFANALGRLPL